MALAEKLKLAAVMVRWVVCVSFMFVCIGIALCVRVCVLNGETNAIEDEQRRRCGVFSLGVLV